MIENLAPKVDIILVRTLGIPPILAAFSQFIILCEAFNIKLALCSGGSDPVISLNFKDRVRAEGLLDIVPAGNNRTFSLTFFGLSVRGSTPIKSVVFAYNKIRYILISV